MPATLAPRVVALAAFTLLVACETTPDTGVTDPIVANTPSFTVSNFTPWSAPDDLGPPVNTSYNELQPALSKDGLTLYFQSNRPEHEADVVLDQNIWVSRRACSTCDWTSVTVLGPPVNSADLDVAPSLSRDEHWLFFTSNRPGSQERDIYVAYRRDVHDHLGWESAVNLGSGINSAGAEVAPSYFENDEEGVPQLFFNRGAPGGDIYVSTLTADGTWGPASPVAELNTVDHSEQRPSVRYNGMEIYFWSDRTDGARIWHATRASVSDVWSDPVMVPAPISEAPSLHPFIHSHGGTETLLFSRMVPARGLDLYVSTRTRGNP